MKTKRIGAGDFLALGLYAFGGFGLELVVGLLLPGVLGVPAGEYTLRHHCIHWALTCVVWGSAGVFLAHLSRVQVGFDVLQHRAVPSPRQWVAAFALAAVAVAATTLAWGGFKPLLEYDTPTKLFFQTVYYLFEAGLLLLTVAFGQKFGEVWTGCTTLPFGGLFLALTWGAMHILLQDVQTGIYAMAMALLYGGMYLFLKKNFLYAYLLVALVFIL